MVNSIEERIKIVMSAVFEIPSDKINEDSSPDTISSWDSLKHLNMVIALEEEFGCEFSDSETVELLNFKLIFEIINSHDVI